MKHLTAVFYLTWTAMWLNLITARLDCLEGTELETEFCKVYDQHKEQETTVSICPILGRLYTEFCPTDTDAPSAPSTPSKSPATTEEEITESHNPHTTTKDFATNNTEEYMTTSNEAYTERLESDNCNCTMPTTTSGGALTFGVTVVAILGVMTGVLFVALVVVTMALVWTCKKKRKTNAGKWTINFQNSSLETTDTYQQSLSRDTLNSPPQLPPFYLTTEYSSLGLPVPTYKSPLARRHPAIEEEDREEHMYDTITRDSESNGSEQGVYHVPVTRRRVEMVEMERNGRGFLHGERDRNEIRSEARMIHLHCGRDNVPPQHFINEHFEEMEEEFSDENGQQAYNLLESIQEEPEELEEEDHNEQMDGVRDLESNQHTYQVLERNGESLQIANEHKDLPEVAYTLDSEGESGIREADTSVGEGTATPEEYETPVHSQKMNGRKNKESDVGDECTTEAAIRSKLNIHVHVSACTHTS